MQKLESLIKELKEELSTTDLIPELIKARLTARLDEAERHLPRKQKN